MPTTAAPPLPLPLTSLVGRSIEALELDDTLRRPGTRLVTVTGPGGVGKTRIALEVAAQAASAFPDGVWYVPLDAIRDPALVLPTIAQAVGVPDTDGAGVVERMAAAIGAGRHLIVLDNAEQVAEAAGDLMELLRRCPGATLLVTSRTPLGVPGEREFPLGPLRLPEETAELAELADAPAIRLFVERATEVQPSFALTPETAPTVAAICRRLDGIPLAIELAAARSKLLSPAALLDRLERQLDVLTSGSRALPARQQTMRAAIAWSYDLLTPAEQRVFRALGVCRGGFGLEELEIALGRTTAAFELVASLVNHSLVRRVDEGEGQPRLDLYQTVREFALERLHEADETAAARSAHAAAVLDLVERADAHLTGPNQKEWLDRLERDHDNIRAALGLALESGDTELGYGIAGRLWRFWWVRGHLVEGRRWLEALLALPATGGLTTARANALRGAAALAEDQGDYERAIAYYDQALVAARRLGDRSLEAKVIDAQGNVAHDRGSYDEAIHLHRAALAIFEELGDAGWTARALHNLGTVSFFRGDLDAAEAAYTRSLAIFREQGDQLTIAVNSANLGAIKLERGQYREAAEHQEAALAAAMAIGDEVSTIHARINLAEANIGLGDLARATGYADEAYAVAERMGAKRLVGALTAIRGRIAMAEGDLAAAARQLTEAVRILWECGDISAMSDTLHSASQLALQLDGPELAVRLLAGATTLHDSLGAVRTPSEARDHEAALSAIRAAVEPGAYDALWAAGAALDGAAIADEAAALTGLASRAVADGDDGLSERTGLTRRELAVLRLFAAGRTNGEIAAALNTPLPVATADVGRLYTKLGLDSRASLTAFAFKHGIV